MHARQAFEMYTQLFGTESAKVANAMGVIADVLHYFNDVDDDEVLRLREQAIAIYRRVEGSSSMNVAAGEHNLGVAYINRANRALLANDLDRQLTNMKLALPHHREAARIFKAIKYLEKVDEVLREIAAIEENIRRVGIANAAAPTTTRR